MSIDIMTDKGMEAEHLLQRHQILERDRKMIKNMSVCSVYKDVIL